jgi:pimeloyl-ACP methyl ester carboxylesterase
MSGRRSCLLIAGRIVLTLALIPLVLGLAGAVYQAAAAGTDQRNYPPPGQLIDVGGYRLHLFCTGEGSPTVILDALFPGTVSNWAWVQPEIARGTRVCAYDRAGLGWSDSGPEPRDARRQAQELHTLLANAKVSGPYVLVGHSLGGLTVRMFADLYPDEVAGMVLVEATNPDAWKRHGKPEGVGADANMLAAAPFVSRLGVFRLGLIPSFSSDPDLPPRQFEELQAFFNSTKAWETIRDVNTSFSSALDQVRKAGSLGDIPLVVVLGSKGDGGDELLSDLFDQQASQSTNSVTRVIEGATHASLVDRQDHALQTSDAIREVVEAARSGEMLQKER